MAPRQYRQMFTMVCIVCDKTFIAHDRRTMYCDRNCKQAMYRLRKKRRDARNRAASARKTNR